MKFFSFMTKDDFWACLVGSGSKFIFHWKAKLCIISKSLLRLFAKIFLSWITENKDVLFPNNLALVESPSERSFISIKNNNGPRIKPWGTPAVAFVHVETWPLATTAPCLLSLKKSSKSLSKFPDISFWVNLKIIFLCQILSNAFKMPRKTPLTSWFWQKDL